MEVVFTRDRKTKRVESLQLITNTFEDERILTELTIAMRVGCDVEVIPDEGNQFSFGFHSNTDMGQGSD